MSGCQLLKPLSPPAPQNGGGVEIHPSGGAGVLSALPDTLSIGSAHPILKSRSSEVLLFMGRYDAYWKSPWLRWG